MEDTTMTKKEKFAHTGTCSHGDRPPVRSTPKPKNRYHPLVAILLLDNNIIVERMLPYGCSDVTCREKVTRLQGANDVGTGRETISCSHGDRPPVRSTPKPKNRYHPLVAILLLDNNIIVERMLPYGCSDVTCREKVTRLQGANDVGTGRETISRESAAGVFLISSGRC